jgi:hypothetical protein
MKLDQSVELLAKQVETALLARSNASRKGGISPGPHQDAQAARGGCGDPRAQVRPP